MELRSGDSLIHVAGTTIGSDDRPWLVNILGFEIDLELAPRIVLCRYDDIPGVIGRVGTMFGEAGINIAGMTVSRSRQSGKALMALTVDSAPSPELVQRLRGDGVGRSRGAETRLAVDANCQGSGAGAAWELEYAVVPAIGNEQIPVRCQSDPGWRTQRVRTDGS